MRGRKCLDDVCAEAIEPFVIAQVSGELTFVAVDKNHIDVGTVIEFAAAEFSQPEHGEFRIRRTEDGCAVLDSSAEKLASRQIAASCESSSVVSSILATSATSRKAMRVISRPFHRRSISKLFCAMSP